MSPKAEVPLRRMTRLSLVGALYFMVSGGPYGLEELPRDVGFGWAVVVITVVPLVWSLPTALMVGELASALPEEGGYYAWVKRALGPFWGVQEAWLSLAASVFDMAIYPTIFTLYLGRFFPVVAQWPHAVGAAVIAVGAAYNLTGARRVGQGSTLMTVLLLCPFALLVALALGHVTPATPAPATVAPDLAGGVLVAMWNTMGWDNASTIATEVDDPQRTYPVAVLGAVVLVTVPYVLVLGALGLAHVDPSAWDTGAFVDVARSFGGRGLAAAVVLGGMVGAFGMFNALCLSYSRVPAALADDGVLPSVLGRRTARSDTPWVSVLVCALAWTASLGLPFERLVSLDILLYGTSLLLEFVALVVLREREPDLPRPFRVPGGRVVAWLLGLGPLLLMGFALFKNSGETVLGVSALWFALAVVALGPLVYALRRRAR